MALALFAAACAAGTSDVASGSGDVASAGRQLASERCGSCHAIGREPAISPHESAPPFTEIVQLYPAESLSEALAEGIMVGHEDMPEFRFTKDEVHDLIRYLKSLE